MTTMEDLVARHWWIRPVRAVTVGIAIGLGLTYLIGLLPSGKVQAAALILLLAAMFAWCIYQLRVLKRERAEFERRMAEFRRLLESHDQ